MTCYNNKNVRACATAAALTVLLASCQSDWHNGVEPQWTDDALAFTATVSPGAMATRADGSIVNLNELKLPSTKMRTYYRADPDGNVPAEGIKAQYKAGIFGCYTGPYKWHDLAALHEADIWEKCSDDVKAAFTGLTSDNYAAKRKAILDEYYTANQLYNVEATIEEATTAGANPLTYSPLRFWPNKRVDANNHEYMTFWAYYPYNATSDVGQLGIGISNTDDGVGTGHGLGRVHFTMHPDAAQQNDFMVSSPVVDRNRDTNPLLQEPQGTFNPKPVQFRMFHMLAQVRLYAFIRGTDKLVYLDETYTADDEAKEEKYTDEWGAEHLVKAGQKKIDEANSVRWLRTQHTDILGEKYRADISYKMEFNNINTQTTFWPEYLSDGSIAIRYDKDEKVLGSATVNHFIMNPYWFRFDETDKRRYMLNDNYMFGHFEDTPVYKQEDATTGLDGINWSTYTSTDPLHYLQPNGSDWTCEKELGVQGEEIENGTGPYFSKHYNYAPGNILMVVPQELDDDDVPHIVLTARGKKAVWDDVTQKWKEGPEITARVTINMLNMQIKWESGFIYCYAIIDELHPGDDIVRGPESITVVFDTENYTDQW